MADIVQSHRQLKQCQRIPLRLGQQALPNPRRQRREPILKQRCSRSPVQRPQLITRQATSLEVAPFFWPRGGKQPDAAAGCPACHEPEDDSAGTIQPGHVINDHEHRRRGGRMADQGQRGIGYQQLAGHRTLAEAQGNGQGFTVRLVKLSKRSKKRMQQLMERCEHDISLELRSYRGQHPDACSRRASGRDCQECCLANPGFSLNQQGTALGSGPVDERADDFRLVVTTDQQPGRWSKGRTISIHLQPSSLERRTTTRKYARRTANQ